MNKRLRQILYGIGLAFDPCPVRRYKTFLRSDEEAMRADWAAIGFDTPEICEVNHESHPPSRAAPGERLRPHTPRLWHWPGSLAMG